MVSIMEKYASNLEALVEERTDQLREEKKKTEELLLQMLPKWVHLAFSVYLIKVYLSHWIKIWFDIKY